MHAEVLIHFFTLILCSSYFPWSVCISPDRLSLLLPAWTRYPFLQPVHWRTIIEIQTANLCNAILKSNFHKLEQARRCSRFIRLALPRCVCGQPYSAYKELNTHADNTRIASWGMVWGGGRIRSTDWQTLTVWILIFLHTHVPFESGYPGRLSENITSEKG